MRKKKRIRPYIVLFLLALTNKTKDNHDSYNLGGYVVTRQAFRSGRQIWTQQMDMDSAGPIIDFS
jgi:hypothetical protein